MRKRPTPSPTELPLPFVYDEQAEEENITALGGMPLLLQAFRSLGTGYSAAQHTHIRQRQRGLDEASYVESFVVLNAAGGDCLDDFERLRADGGLAELIGHELPSPEAARNSCVSFTMRARWWRRNSSNWRWGGASTALASYRGITFHQRVLAIKGQGRATAGLAEAAEPQERDVDLHRGRGQRQIDGLRTLEDR